MEEKDLDKIIEKMEKMVDAMGLRDDYEKFKEEHKDKSLEELLGELKESIVGNHKPKFEIMIKSNEDGETHQTKVVGRCADVLFGLSELVADMKKQLGIPDALIRKTVETGLSDKEE